MNRYVEEVANPWTALINLSLFSRSFARFAETIGSNLSNHFPIENKLDQFTHSFRTEWRDLPACWGRLWLPTCPHLSIVADSFARLPPPPVAPAATSWARAVTGIGIAPCCSKEIQDRCYWLYWFLYSAWFSPHKLILDFQFGSRHMNMTSSFSNQCIKRSWIPLWFPTPLASTGGSEPASWAWALSRRHLAAGN